MSLKPGIRLQGLYSFPVVAVTKDHQLDTLNILPVPTHFCYLEVRSLDAGFTGLKPSCW